MARDAQWDVAVVGGGPAGLAAASAAAAGGARTVVLERAEYPRYKTCGGGLVGASLEAIDRYVCVPVRERIRAATFTLDGRREFTRTCDEAFLSMVTREEFDDALRKRAADLGAVVQRARARGISQEPGLVRVQTAEGSEVTATVVIGADGSSGVSARHVGVEFSQVDLGLEVELEVPEQVQADWQDRVLLDWGRIPGSYGWVFPKGGRLTVGVIAGRGRGDETRQYLGRFIDRLRLSSYEPSHDSGHLTRCRADDSPLRKGRVLVAGDAAGLLEPWTREGISFALRSGARAGTVGALAAQEGDREQAGRVLDRYASALQDDLIPEMQAGRRLLAAFTRHPGAFHAGLATPKGWKFFVRVCRSDITFPEVTGRRPVRMALSVLSHS